MKIRRRNNLLVEPPASATGDIAFNLIIFFLVCMSVQPEDGVRLAVPSPDKTKEKLKSIEITLTPEIVLIDQVKVEIDDVRKVIEAKLEGKTDPAERVVVIETQKTSETLADRWIPVVTAVHLAGGTITLRIVKKKTIVAQ
ncbi:MAG: biopolymer transporter ExbD [Planctomycetes bacterium]|nr:biopolymer transporter ExbD [Planctomycetota bacterium]